MYDTNFFRNTYELKNKILNREFAGKDSNDILDKLNAHISPSPFVFNLETTNLCNMSCIMCQRTTDFKQKLWQMDDTTFNLVLKQVKPQEKTILTEWQEFVNKRLRGSERDPSENNFYYDIVFKSITMHGFGEPLLDPRLPDRVSALSKLNIPTYFSCNPCNIRLDFIKRLLEAGAGYIKFAIDSLDDDEAKKIRGKNADFTKSYQQVLEVLDLKRRMKADTVIALTMLNFSGNSNIETRFLDLWKGKDVYAYVKSVDNKWLLDKKLEENKTSGENKSHYKKQYCDFAWTSITILSDGSVVPCTQDINGTWVFGNVKDQSLREIWNSDKYLEFRRLQLSKDHPEDFMCHSKCDLDIASYFYNDYGK
ncbi:MAG: radical SAM protein [Candidatus Brocadiaceae bacterium]|nr:radical SAM protein [Candidatus Brocadiaceae bacterium]